MVPVLLAVVLLLPHAAAAAETACPAQPQWFTGVPSLPAFEPRSSCQFQQWAWQSFLALLETDRSQPTARYFNWALPNPTMTDLFCNRFCGIANQKPRNPCGGPATQEVVNATTQPGFVRANTSGELIDQAGEPVYFTAHVNPRWVDFVTRNQFYDPEVQGDADPRTAFPAGAFEIKSSWRLARKMSPAEKAQYYTTEACVVPEHPAAGEPKQFVAEIALVGFHITGGVQNHPELVWATFEHVRNAPDCQSTPQAGPWAFYDGTTDCRRGRPAPCNRPNPAAGPANPINVCRQYPHGGASSQIGREIAALNRDVQNHLPRDSKWRFYELVGTVWASDPSPEGVPTVNLQDPAGSPLLANTTLETFKQNVSCFGCHSSQFPGEFASLAGSSPVVNQAKTLFVSHVVLFPFFFEADTRGGKTGCANTCTSPPALTPGTLPAHVPFQ
ncbi:MAG TPA: hypothetical protein VKK31_09730 [Thermoanaerobaculia bacterium]|nr:hypothetical protein [Thermoanaerobaculia bacterium]